MFVTAVGLLVVLGVHANRLAGLLHFMTVGPQAGTQANSAGGQDEPGAIDNRAPTAAAGGGIPDAFVATSAPPSSPIGKLAPVSGSRDLLRAYGLDEVFFARLADGRPWQEGENEILLKVLYRLRGYSLEDVERWSRGKPNLAELAESPRAQRGAIFQLAGHVVSVSVIRPDRDVAERFELAEYYRCEMVLAEDQQPALVFAPKIPKAWKGGGPVSQRVGAWGMFLKLGEAKTPNHPAPIFVAQRVAWYAPTLLGDLGMDMGLFDDVRQDDRAEEDAPPKKAAHPNLGALKLTARDRECFYQLLAAVGRAKPGQLMEAAEQGLQRTGQRAYSVEPLFLQPQGQQGRLVALAGTVRQVIPVRVSEPDIVARFGIRQYYQMAVFTDDSQNNPVIFCVRDLPEGMPTGEGARYAESVKVAGFFFKTWGYRSREPVEEPGKVRWQMAPLLIGSQPVWIPQQPLVQDRLSGTIAAVLLILAAVGGMAILWRARRRDRAFREQVIEKRFQPGPSRSLNEPGIEAEGKPDFSHLDNTSENPEDEGRK